MPKINIIHKSLYKPVLFVGCERLPFTLITLCCGLIIMEYQSTTAIILSIIIYFISIMMVRRVNIEDAQYFQCLYRYIRFYLDYYPANAFYPGTKDKVQGIK
ncbi:MAG: VirB3 family type IV secretion system protein [Burkholderiales bacterium]|nr:VirB3 family type IV secretion system protein [Burkholderiales bacterium]